ncbi:hypothetical protein V6N11_069504 [Hibiscus sabdariffa]|uniref:Uncharacterized protein n=1 Tax=Hibiscus sabdariffa TaxID=183260 RepID=A0ABR2Q301_9ROSI
MLIKPGSVSCSIFETCILNFTRDPIENEGVRVRSGELRQNVPIGSGELLLDWPGTLKDLFSRVVFVRNKKVARGLYSQARKLAPSSSPIFAPLPDKAHPFAESFLPKKEE